ncbi:MAG: hypothetical protein NC389_10015 [Acetatifactor muris]|nr:hypothetical protein [Acetatifactor muris]
MRQLYEKINELLQLVPFEDICHGFRRCGFAVYNADTVWLRNRVIPWDHRFIGNTAVEFEGEFIAVYQVENPQDTDPEILAADMVHEMFHAHQMRSGENRWPDDLTLLAYPENTENYRLKYAENQLLAAAYSETGARKAGLLSAFREIRKQRRNLAGDYLDQELLAEHIEGRAEYAGCRALKAIAPDKFREKIKGYLSALRSPDRAFFDIRRQAYITGAVYGLACGDCKEEEPLGRMLRQYRQFKEEQVKTFLEQNPVERKGDCLICGYDPMNMILCGRQVLCTHFVTLQFGEAVKFLEGPVLLELKAGNVRKVRKYWVPVQEKS